jgi:2,3-bisphosphoglycerate-dependent phosphoglycerate mutase
MGHEVVRRWRRSYATRPPGGESLADTAARTLPFMQGTVMQNLRAGKHALVSAHGNSLRAIVMALEGIDEHSVSGMELPTAVPVVYEIDTQGRVTDRTRLEG